MGAVVLSIYMIKQAQLGFDGLVGGFGFFAADYGFTMLNLGEDRFHQRPTFLLVVFFLQVGGDDKASDDEKAGANDAEIDLPIQREVLKKQSRSRIVSLTH